MCGRHAITSAPEAILGLFGIGWCLTQSFRRGTTLRLPAVKLMWARLVEQYERKAGPQLVPGGAMLTLLRLRSSPVSGLQSVSRSTWRRPPSCPYLIAASPVFRSSAFITGRELH